MSVNDYRTPPTGDIFEVKPGPSEYSATFIFGNEDHTLGNSLRYILMQRNETDFCGYSVPHPYEPKVNIRLQTKGVPSAEVLKAGLHDMIRLTEQLDTEFEKALEKFRKLK